MLIQDTMTKEAWLWRSSSCADSLAQTLYFCLWFYIRKSSFPETNSSPLKINGWKRIVSFWDGLFSGAMLVLGSLTRKLTLLLLGEKALVLENWPFKNRGNLSIYIYTYIYILCISYIYIDIYCFIYTERDIYTQPPYQPPPTHFYRFPSPEKMRLRARRKLPIWLPHPIVTHKTLVQTRKWQPPRFPVTENTLR